MRWSISRNNNAFYIFWVVGAQLLFNEINFGVAALCCFAKFKPADQQNPWIYIAYKEHGKGIQLKYVESQFNFSNNNWADLDTIVLPSY